MKNRKAKLIWPAAKYGTYIKDVFGEIGTKAIPATEQQLKNREIVENNYQKALKNTDPIKPEPETEPEKIQITETAQPNIWQKISLWVIRFINRFKI